MEFPQLIADILEATGWSEQELADKAGVSQPTINRIRNGISWPMRDTAQALLKLQPKAKRNGK